MDTIHFNRAPSGFRRFKMIETPTAREILEQCICGNPYNKMRELEKRLIPCGSRYVNGAFENPRIEANYQALKTAREAIMCVVGSGGYHSATAQDIATAVDVLF